MPGFFLRQTLLAGLIVINLLLLILSIDWLLFEPVAAFLFLVLFTLALLAIAVTGLLVTAGSRSTLPYRAVMGYLLWAPSRASRFSAHVFGLLLLLATLWLTGPRAIFRLEANCQSAPAVSAAGFLGRIVRIPCAAQHATVQLYQPFRTLDFAKDRVSCVDAAGALFPAASEIGSIVTCRNAPSRAALRIDRLEPPVIEANRIRRYRLHGAGLTKDLSVTLDAPSFVGSSLSRDSDQHPAEVDPHGQWADVFLSVMPVAGRDSVALRLTNESNQTARFAAPVQAAALR